jgi:uncharacterized membrane protein
MLNPLAVTLGITGIVLLAGGFLLYRKPPARINWFYGYRTSASMRSRERWEFAQVEGARALMQAGGTLMLLAIPSFFWWPLPNYGLFLAILALVAAVVFVFWKVQGRLRKKFGP